MSFTIKNYNIVNNFSYALFRTEDIEPYKDNLIIFPNDAKPLTCGHDKKEAEYLKKYYENQSFD